MLQAHLLLALLWIGFGLLHSVLASASLKAWFTQRWPKQAVHYRLWYTLFAFVTFGLVLWYTIILQSPLLFTTNGATQLAGGIIAVTGLVIMAVCIKKYFLSLSGLKSLFTKRPSHQLMISGIHRFMRHPLYAGTFLAIWGGFIFYPTLSFFITNFIITAYTLIGIRFEEKKLLAEFGADYKTYRQTVPKLIPAFGRKPL